MATVNVLRSDDVFEMPEFKDFCKRIGLPIGESSIVSLNIKLEADSPVVITVERYCEGEHNVRK